MITWEVMQKVFQKANITMPIDVEASEQIAKTVHTRMATIFATVVEKHLKVEELTDEQRTAIAYLSGLPFNTRRSEDGMGFLLQPLLPFGIFLKDGKYGVVCKQMPQHAD